MRLLPLSSLRVSRSAIWSLTLFSKLCFHSLRLTFITILREAKDPFGWSCGTFPWPLGPSLPALIALLNYIPLKSTHWALNNIPSLCPAWCAPTLTPQFQAHQPPPSLCLLCDLFLSLTLVHPLFSLPPCRVSVPGEPVLGIPPFSVGLLRICIP